MEADLADLRAAAASKDEAKAQAAALELKIAQHERQERERRAEFDKQLQGHEEQMAQEQARCVVAESAHVAHASLQYHSPVVK
jgi:hypothetical protein